MNNKEIASLWYYPTISKWATIYRLENNTFYAYIRESENDTGISDSIKFMSDGLNAEEVKKDFIQAYIDFNNL